MKSQTPGPKGLDFELGHSFDIGILNFVIALFF
jgi:hypothetical protein